ncbi:MAG: hypothetical protein NC204_06995 [Candidatus Amulumruptor caecigallinarius]|nr:hypothetical protein [Candidatus Amulumruptor caecigallinarius]
MKISAKWSLAAAALIACPFVTMADEEPDYLRSSLYTILLNSKTQNQRIEEENNNVAGNEFMEMAKGFAKTDEKKAANDNSTLKLGEIPMAEFMGIAIPNQFNDHNLSVRTIDFDTYKNGISKEQADEMNTKFTGKKKGGGFMKALGAAALSTAAGGETGLINTDDTGDYMIAVVDKFLQDDNTAAKMTARWFDYDTATGKWDPSQKTLNERAIQSLNIREQSEGGEGQATAAGAKAFNLIPNTFLMTVNLSFRSNKALVAGAQKLAGGLLGSGAASMLGAAASAAAGDGYSVQAQTTLWRLVWDENTEMAISNALEKGQKLDDLIKSGACKLEFVGKDKATARVRQSLFSDKPISSLVSRATTRAIDAAIAKLQEGNEVFRTKFPISSCDADGNIKVKIGTKEGVSKGDTYAILEQQEGPDGKYIYKEVATVKPNEKLIWNNVFGAEEEAAENSKNKDGKSEDFNNDAVSLGYTTFVGKKGKDFSGYYIQLKKKK